MVNGFAYGDGFAGIKNDSDVLYVKGDEKTDGSLRVIPDSIKSKNVAVQERKDGVWNNTGVNVGPRSIDLGRHVSVSASGGYVGASDTLTEHDYALSRVQFSDVGTLLPESLTAGPLIVDFPVSLDESNEFVGTLFTAQVIAGVPNPEGGFNDALFQSFRLKTGSVASTAPVTFSFYIGPDNTGRVLWQEETPIALTDTANAEFVIALSGAVSSPAGDILTFEAKSDETFSLATGVTDFPFSLATFRIIDSENLIMENLAIGDDASLILTENAEFVMTGNLSNAQ